MCTCMYMDTFSSCVCKVDLLGVWGIVGCCEYVMRHLSTLYPANSTPTCVTLYCSAFVRAFSYIYHEAGMLTETSQPPSRKRSIIHAQICRILQHTAIRKTTSKNSCSYCHCAIMKRMVLYMCVRSLRVSLSLRMPTLPFKCFPHHWVVLMSMCWCLWKMLVNTQVLLVNMLKCCT